MRTVFMLSVSPAPVIRGHESQGRGRLYHISDRNGSIVTRNYAFTARNGRKVEASSPEIYIFQWKYVMKCNY